MSSSLRERLQGFLSRHPLAAVLLSGLLLRLVAAIFSRGYMASDDHFQVVEIAAEWMRGHPVFLRGGEQFYRSLLFPGFHWILMSACHRVGILHPDAVMLCVRLALGLFSLWPIVIIWRYGEALGGRPVALPAAWLMAAHPLMPYSSVRSLVEMACLPFLLYSLYRLDRGERTEDGKSALAAGAVFGLALALRTQLVSAGLGIAVYLIFRGRKRWLLLWLAGAALPMTAQGLWDWTLHGRFLGSVWTYLEHNRANLYGYVVGPWYRYLLLIPGVFLPPFGLIFFASMFRGVRRQGVLFWATASFVIVHSLVPQKQERFLLPMFPELVLMGVWGLAQWTGRMGKWIRPGWIFFWAVSIPLLVVSLFDYGQKAKVVPLVELFERGDARGVVVDMSVESALLPMFYLDGGIPQRDRPPIFEARSVTEMDSLRRAFTAGPAAARPNYVIIFSTGRVKDPLSPVRAHLGELAGIVHVSPSLADRVLRRLNPRYNRGKEAWLAELRWPPVQP